MEDWKSVVERKELVYILTTDISKAFDSLCHSLIVEKLEDYGFGKILSTFLDHTSTIGLTESKIKDVTSD